MIFVPFAAEIIALKLAVYLEETVQNWWIYDRICEFWNTCSQIAICVLFFGYRTQILQTCMECETFDIYILRY